MTRSEFIRAVRRLYIRRKMIEDIETLEAQIIAYLVSNGYEERLVYAGAYKVLLADNELIITETPRMDERQLELLKDYFVLTPK
jgi:hypothetical protein